MQASRAVPDRIRDSLLTGTALPTWYRKAMKQAAKVTSKGQITIPLRVRQALKLNPGDQVTFEVHERSGTPVAQLERAPDFFALAGSIPPKREVPRTWSDERRLAREEHGRHRAD